MPKYIKAEALIDDLRGLAEANKGTYHEEGFKNAITVVEMQDPADVVDKERYANLLANSIIVCEALKKYQSEDMVQVVRCNDCKFWKTETEPLGIECEPGETAHYCELGGIWRSGDFCKYGHRKVYYEESTKRSD